MLATLVPRRDLHAYTNWRVKCEDRESARYHAEVQHRLARQKAAMQQVRELFDSSSRAWMGSLVCTSSAATMLAELNEAVDKIAKTRHLKRNQVVVFPFLNWGAPSLIKSDEMKAQSQVLGAILAAHGQDEGTAVGVVMTPAYCYTRGGLYKQMENIHSLLANSRVNFDQHFVLPFTERTDERDQRHGS